MLVVVLEKWSHVPNEQRKYKTYHLTDPGIAEFERIRTIIDNMTVPVVDFQLVQHEKSVSEIPALFSSRIRTVEILNYLAGKEVLNCSQFQRHIESQRESEFISILYRLPGLRYFYGRSKERRRFQEWLESDPEEFDNAIYSVMANDTATR